MLGQCHYGTSHWQWCRYPERMGEWRPASWENCNKLTWVPSYPACSPQRFPSWTRVPSQYAGNEAQAEYHGETYSNASFDLLLLIKTWNSIPWKEKELGEVLKNKLFILCLIAVAFPLQKIPPSHRRFLYPPCLWWDLRCRLPLLPGLSDPPLCSSDWNSGRLSSKAGVRRLLWNVPRVTTSKHFW